jgi:hypothetical protein
MFFSCFNSVNALLAGCSYGRLSVHRKILSRDKYMFQLILLSCGARHTVRWVLTEGVLLTFWAWIPEISSSNPGRVIFFDDAYIGLDNFLSNIWKIIFYLLSNNSTTHKVNKYVLCKRQFMLAKSVWFIYEHHWCVHSLVTCCTHMIYFVRNQMFLEVTILRPCEPSVWIQMRGECDVIAPCVPYITYIYRCRHSRRIEFPLAEYTPGP